MEETESRLKKMGFIKYDVSPTDQEIQEQEWLNEKGIVIELFAPVVYERQLSRFTSFIIEGEFVRGTYIYDFYKIKYHYQSKKVIEEKLYCSGVRDAQLLDRVRGLLIYCGMLTDEMPRVKRVKNSNNFYEGKIKQKKIDIQRKQALGII